MHSRSNLLIFKIALFWECFAQKLAMWGRFIAEGGEGNAGTSDRRKRRERSICGLSLPEKDTDLRLFGWRRKVICNYTEKVGDLAPHN